MLLTEFLLGYLLMATDTVIFVHQHLQFLINTEKSYLEQTSNLEFLGMIIDSMGMTLSPHKGKVLKVQNQYKKVLEKENVTFKELSKIIGRLRN